MAEKSTLVEKLPPIAKAEAPVVPLPPSSTAPASGNNNNTSVKAPIAQTAERKEESKPATATKADAQEPVAAVASTAVPPEATATVLQHVTYYTFLGDALIWGLLGVCLFGKAFKDKAKVQFVSMAIYGGLLVLLGMIYFIYSKEFAAYLFGEIGEPTLMIRALGWMLATPALFYVIARMIRVPAHDKKLYLAMFGLGGGLFLFIALSQLMSNRLEAAGLAIFPLLFAGSLTYLMFMTLGKGARSIRGKVKQSVSLIVYATTATFFVYPILTLLNCFAPNLTVYNLLLNFVDLAVLSCITYGLWGSMASSNERIAFTQSFGSVKRSSASPFPASEETVLTANQDEDPNNLEATKAKPSLKRPQRPAEISNN